MGAGVLQPELSAGGGAGGQFRVYAHCSAAAEAGARAAGLAAGAVTALVINLQNESVALSFDRSLGGLARAYVRRDDSLHSTSARLTYDLSEVDG
jgi:hypothetical protein